MNHAVDSPEVGPTTRNGLPTDIEHMTAGLALARLLEGVDRSRLNGHELVSLVQARAREVSRLQAEFYADVLELAYTPPCHPDDPPERTDGLDTETADEIRAALPLTRRAAEIQLDLAWRLVKRIPAVWEALQSGDIDLPRARVILDRTDHLDESIARDIAARILTEASELTTGQIRGRLDRLCVEADPDEAAKRYEKRVEDRRVEAHRQPEGTADLVGMNLPGDRVAAIMDRLTRIARKRRGRNESRSMDQLRADAFLELLEGCHRQSEPDSRPMVDIRIELPTLLGLDEKAGEIPGWGPIISDVARRVVERQAEGQWRVVVTDPDSGNILWDGTTRRRPSAEQRRWVEARQTTCVFPGCRHPARTSDIDHAIEVSEGGQTLVRHLEPACRHDHGLRHQGGWSLEQPLPGRYVWTSPRGHTYVTGRSPP